MLILHHAKRRQQSHKKLLFCFSGMLEDGHFSPQFIGVGFGDKERGVVEFDFKKVDYLVVAVNE